MVGGRFVERQSHEVADGQGIGSPPVTLGSPLGLRTVVYGRLRPQPPRFPPNVRHWVNVADRDDLVAAEPDLTDLFSEGRPTTATLEGGYTVDNGAEPHRPDFYLGKVEVGRPVGAALRA